MNRIRVLMGCWRGRLAEKGSEAQQEKESLCYNLDTKSWKQRGGGVGSKRIFFED